MHTPYLVFCYVLLGKHGNVSYFADGGRLSHRHCTAAPSHSKYTLGAALSKLISTNGEANDQSGVVFHAHVVAGKCAGVLGGESRRFVA